MSKTKVFVEGEWPEVLSDLDPMAMVECGFYYVSGTLDVPLCFLMEQNHAIVAWVKYSTDDIIPRAPAETAQPAPANTAVLILAAAATHIANRADTYDKDGGDGERSMGAAVAAYNAIHGTAMSEAQGWHLLQLLKDVRLFTAPSYHADSAEDCIGYAALKAEALANAGAETAGD